MQFMVAIQTIDFKGRSRYCFSREYGCQIDYTGYKKYTGHRGYAGNRIYSFHRFMQVIEVALFIELYSDHRRNMGNRSDTIEVTLHIP